ncbi:MAG: hypothetical protein EOO11_04275 [Chitinophagaceae bacterium]|nr:MAG: hypothetical protein EOO11_04275 [Chitinophagaceae bacterium]
MNPRTLLRLFLCLLLAASVVACGTPARSLAKTYGTLNIPAGINADGQTLLIKIPYDGRDWVDAFRRNADYAYKDRHQVVPASTSIDTEYPDRDSYRYVLMLRPMDATRDRAKAVTSSPDNYDAAIAGKAYKGFGPHDYSAFYLIDRVGNKVYDGGMQSDQLFTYLRYYMEQISKR